MHQKHILRCAGEELPPDIERAFADLARQFAPAAPLAGAPGQAAHGSVTVDSAAIPAPPQPEEGSPAAEVVRIAEPPAPASHGAEHAPVSEPGASAGYRVSEPGASAASEAPKDDGEMQDASALPVIPAAAVDAVLEGAAVLSERADVLVTDLLDYRCRTLALQGFLSQVLELHGLGFRTDTVRRIAS